MGVTGSSAEIAMNVELPNILKRVRQYATVPLAVGFGVATRQHFDAVVNAGADGVVIGSRIVSIIKSSSPQDIVKNVENYCSEITLKGKEQPSHNGKATNGHVTMPVVNESRKDEPTVCNTASDPTVLPARFGEFGGQYVPEALVDCLVELEAAHKSAMADKAFWDEFKGLYGYMNRPSILYYSERLTEHAGGAKIWLKREDL